MKTLVAVIATALACTVTTATAATLITGRQIKNGTVTSRDIKNRSIRPIDLAVPARAIPGPTGPQGAQGPKGDTPRPVTGSDQTVIPAGRTTDVWALCPSGAPVGGGYRFEHIYGGIAADADITVPVSEPTTIHAGPAWHLLIRNDGTESLLAITTVSCL